MRSQNSECCFDFEVNVLRHRQNWKSSWKTDKPDDDENVDSDSGEDETSSEDE